MLFEMEANVSETLEGLSRAELVELVKELQSKTADREISFKVSEKGAVSVYGLGRWPVTLYAQQWGRLLEKADELEKFIEANSAKLSWKD